MKKRFTFILGLLMICSAFITAQSVPNSGFESWTNTNFFEEPTPFATSNSVSFLTGGNLNVTKTTDAHGGTYAARLETVQNMNDTVPGLMMIGKLQGTLIGGGMPFGDRPDSLTGWVKYDMAGGDNVIILVLFKNSGTPLGLIQASFDGTQDTYTRFSVPVTWYIPLINPDSVNIVIATTASITSGNPGSTLYVDDFNFVNSSDPFPNGDFETWNMLNDEEPDNWSTINYLTLTTDEPYATKTSDSYTGDWAIRIENMESFVQEVVGYLTNGHFQGYNWAGGMAVDQNPSAVHGYYKYMPQGDDSAQVTVSSYRFNTVQDTIEILEQKLINLPPASVYTPFDINMDYNGSPKADTVNISFSAGLNYPDPGMMQVGSVLYLDDISIDYYPVSVSEISPPARKFGLYPNPSKGIVFLQSNEPVKDNFILSVYNLQGKAVIEQNVNGITPGDNVKIDLSSLKNGFYTYTLKNKEILQSGKLSIMH